jgi:hypothetical protein
MDCCTGYVLYVEKIFVGTAFRVRNRILLQQQGLLRLRSLNRLQKIEGLNVIEDLSTSHGASAAAAGRLEKAIVYICVLCVVALLLIQMVGTGFTCDDDMFTATARYRWDGVWNASWSMATGHGRFYHLFVYTLAQIPYLLPGFAVPTAFRVLSTASVFLAFFVATRKLLGCETLAMFLMLILGGLLTTTHGFNPFHGLPMWFNLGLTVLLTAVYFFNVGLECRAVGRRWLGGVFFFISMLFYETFIVYVALFPAIAFFRMQDTGRRVWQRALSALRVSIPIFWAMGLWLMLYLLFRAAFPSHYRGEDISLGSARDMAITVLQFSRAGLNLSALYKLSWAWNTPAASAAVLAGLAFFALFQQLKSKVSGQLLVVLAVLGVLFALAPNAIYAFTPRYREWVRSDPYYLGSFYGAFSLVFSIGATFLFIGRISWKKWISVVLSCALALFFSLNAYANHLESFRFFREHRQNRQLWNLVDDAVSSGLKQMLDANAVLVAPQLVRMPMLSPLAYDYWSYHMRQLLGRPIQVVGVPTDVSQLPAGQKEQLPAPNETGELIGLVVRYNNKFGIGLVAFGKIDAREWVKDPRRLLARRASVRISGKSGHLWLLGGGPDHYTILVPARPTIELQNPVCFDLTTLSLEKR